MTVRKKLVALGLIILLEIAAVLIFARMNVPIIQGTSANFWWYACGVDLGSGENGIGGIYPPRDGWYIYYYNGYPYDNILCVQRSIAISDYPKVLQEIKNAVKKEDVTPKIQRVHAIIEKNRLEVEQNPDKLLLLMGEQLMVEWKMENEELYHYATLEEQEFAERWRRSQRFWMNVVFEIIFFAALSLFALWPWLGDRGKWCKMIHLGLVPLLLFVPYYLGYSGWTFASAVPSGGALYPWVIFWFGNFPIWTPVDYWILNALPQVLEPISQPLGPIRSISGGRPLGPIAALIIGSAISAVIWCISRYK